VASDELKQYHAEQAEIARRIYIDSRTATADLAEADMDVWAAALMGARKLIAKALRESDFLRDVPRGLQTDGTNMLVFRHLMAPPMSQDQFSLICPSWRKGTEKPPEVGARRAGMTVSEAASVAAVFHSRRYRAITPWIQAHRNPRLQELRRLLWSVAPTIASQSVGTVARSRAAAKQEGSVLELLDSKGWTRRLGSILDTRAELPLRHYMYKVRYPTTTSTAQEVDIAMGLYGTYVLAMECKVTNDATNSVKRMNDVAKKAAAWKLKWGEFVKTAALLQGVIAAKDVERLLDEGIHVFWSHNLGALSDWLDEETQPPASRASARARLR
jgi:hypothetical protein